MPELTPDELRAAFADVDEPILPPGSMMLETAREVANRFASAWEADRGRLKRFGRAINIAHHGTGSAFGELSDQDWAYLATLAPQGPTEAGKEKP